MTSNHDRVNNGNTELWRTPSEGGGGGNSGESFFYYLHNRTSTGGGDDVIEPIVYGYSLIVNGNVVADEDDNDIPVIQGSK